MATDLATRTAAPLVAATCRRLGVELPGPVAEKLEAANKLRQSHSRDFLGDAGAQLTEAVAEAIAADRDPLASKAVQRAALALQLGEANIEHRLRDYAEQQAAAALRMHADDVIAAWRPAVESINEALAKFRAAAPGVDVLDESLPTGLPVKALTPWGEAKEATAHLEEVAKGWIALAGAGAVYMPDNTRPLIVADLSLEQFNQLGGRPHAKQVASLDVPLSLASVDTFNERVARLNRERAEEQQWNATAPERARQERRQRFGVVMIP